MRNDYQTPVNDQVSIGLAQQIGERYAFQADFVHTKGRDEPMGATSTSCRIRRPGLPRNPAMFGYRDPRVHAHPAHESTGKSEYTALQTGFNGRPAGRVG